jgi:hypothetical protein
MLRVESTVLEDRQETRQPDQGVQVGHHPGAGQVSADLLHALRIAGRDRRDRRTCLSQQWRVNAPTGRAEPRQAHSRHGDLTSCHHPPGRGSAQAAEPPDASADVMCEC